jgi:hypothetical protein
MAELPKVDPFGMFGFFFFTGGVGKKKGVIDRMV